MQWIRILVPLSVVLLYTGCQTYQAKPLIPSEILKEVEASRNLLSAVHVGEHVAEIEGSVEKSIPGPNPSTYTGFVKTVQWMGQYSPELKRARAEYDQAQSLADIDTPLPNPGIAFGPLIGSNLDSGASHRNQPMVEFGFSVPLSGRISKQDDINRALADEALLSLIVKHRREYLELRSLYSDWVLAEKRLNIQGEIRKSARKSMDLTNRLVKAGAASALDRGLMELEAVQHEALLMQAESERMEVEERLSRLIGISIEKIRSIYSPTLPEMNKAVLPREEAKAIMVENNPDLALLRARYEVSEKQLQLEIKKQYPDFRLGASYEGDPGDTKKIWGLSIGIALPIFDRNQQGIRVAEKEREKVRSAYEATLNESLATLEGLYERYVLAKEKQRLLHDVALPKSEANLEVALQSIQAGTIDSLKYLEVERTMRSLLIEAVDAERETRKVLSDLERIMGMPLVLFPAESINDYPFIPEKAENSINQESLKSSEDIDGEMK